MVYLVVFVSARRKMEFVEVIFRRLMDARDFPDQNDRFRECDVIIHVYSTASFQALGRRLQVNRQICANPSHEVVR